MRHGTRKRQQYGFTKTAPLATHHNQRDACSDKSRQETVSECEEKVAKLTELAAETEERKKILRAGRGPRTEILEASERLRSIYAELATTRRRLEPLVTSCPFCLWSSEPLFIAETGARQMGEPKQRYILGRASSWRT